MVFGCGLNNQIKNGMKDKGETIIIKCYFFTNNMPFFSSYFCYSWAKHVAISSRVVTKVVKIEILSGIVRGFIKSDRKIES